MIGVSLILGIVLCIFGVAGVALSLEGYAFRGTLPWLYFFGLVWGIIAIVLGVYLIGVFV